MNQKLSLPYPALMGDGVILCLWVLFSPLYWWIPVPCICFLAYPMIMGFFGSP